MNSSIKTGAAKFPELGWGSNTSALRGLAVDVNSTVAFNDSKDLAIVGDFANYFLNTVLLKKS